VQLVLDFGMLLHERQAIEIYEINQSGMKGKQNQLWKGAYREELKRTRKRGRSVRGHETMSSAGGDAYL
jgi:hypothetical protein